MSGLGDRQLQKALERLERGELTLEELRNRRPREAAELEQILAAAERVRRLAPAVPSEAFRARTRGRILSARPRSAAPELPRQYAPRSLAQQLGRVLAGATILFALILAGGGFGFAAQNALPGDALFPVKLQL